MISTNSDIILSYKIWDMIFIILSYKEREIPMNQTITQFGPKQEPLLPARDCHGFSVCRCFPRIFSARVLLLPFKAGSSVKGSGDQAAGSRSAFFFNLSFFFFFSFKYQGLGCSRSPLLWAPGCRIRSEIWEHKKRQ